MKCLVFGLGKAGMVALGYLHARGAEIVGVYSRSSHVDADVGLLSGGSGTGLKVRAVSDFVPHRGMADVALFFTTSDVADLLGEPRMCLEHGINVVTIAEQALFPWAFAPDICARLDGIARANNCTLTATGVNDTVMCALPAIVAGIAPDVRHIDIEATGNFGVLGPATLQVLPLGLTPAEYDASHAEAGPVDPAATICGQVALALAAMTGLTPEQIEIAEEPLFSGVAIEVPTLGRIIGAGLTRGIIESVRVRTRQGPTIGIRLHGKLFEAGEEEYLSVRIDGPCPLVMDLRPLPSIETTAAIAVGRAPDVIAAPAGFLTIDRLPAALLRDRAAYA